MAKRPQRRPTRDDLARQINRLARDVRALAKQQAGRDPVTVATVLRRLWLMGRRSRLKKLPEPILRGLVERLIDVRGRPCEAFRWLRRQPVSTAYCMPSTFYRFVIQVRLAAASLCGCPIEDIRAGRRAKRPDPDG